MGKLIGRITLVIFLMAGLMGCKKPNDKVVVATAANVQFVMLKLQQAFEKETGIGLDIVVSSSGEADRADSGRRTLRRVCVGGYPLSPGNIYQWRRGEPAQSLRAWSIGAMVP